MPKDGPLVRPGVVDRLSTFVLERFPFAVPIVRQALEATPVSDDDGSAAAWDRVRQSVAHSLTAALETLMPPSAASLETTPGVTSEERLARAKQELLAACDGFIAREAIAASLTRGERREILRGMLLTRALDNRLKKLFVSGEVRYRDVPFQGKGFRSLGQEAIYAAAIRLRRGSQYRDATNGWQGDVIGPIIRDLGAALAMRPEPDAVRMVMSAQMGKAGPPMDGKDLHIGDFDCGILPATAPLAISTLTIAGMGMAFSLQHVDRVAVSFIGDGGSSLGEWHEAINLCAVHRLPVIFVIENNQIALSTPATAQSRARVFADKAAGYGIQGITIDGTDPDAIAAATAWAAERARKGDGPTLIELVTMRMCGHAHHDDMLYLGIEPRLSLDYPPLDEHTAAGYVDAELYNQWRSRDPIAIYAARLQEENVITPAEVEAYRQDVEALVEREAQAVVAAPWPRAQSAARGVYAGQSSHVRGEPLAAEQRLRTELMPPLPAVEPGRPLDAHGHTFLEAIGMGLADALRADPRVFVYGEDVGGRYGNAFLLLRPLLDEFRDRIINAPLAESGILGVCVGAALAGMRPIGEMQFNDFVATGFNQLVNNAAKIRYRWNGSVPMVVRMPWGGLRHAGPFHSQNTEPWFYRTPGLKIAVPATPEDARALLLAAISDPDPVLFYEHIALYRDPRIKQRLPDDAPVPLPLGHAALRRAGSDLAIVSYGAYVHVALRVAERLAHDGIESSVLDLRTLVPLDTAQLLTVARHCSRVLIVHEDSRTGGIGESLAAIIQEEAFESLDAPVRVLGALDTPVPYSPPLEEFFLPSEAGIETAARRLLAY